MKKRILFTLYKGKCHSLYKQFLFNPPEGFEYFTLDDFIEDFIFHESGNIFIEVLNKIKRNYRIIKVAKQNRIDVIYCTSGLLLFNSPIPWVVEFESVSSFVIHKLKYWGFFKKILPTVLRQKNLKALIPWTDAAARSLLLNIEDKESVITKKMTTVHLCLNHLDSTSEKSSGKPDVFTLLFVTTLNNNAEKEFYTKGGRIVAEIFRALKKRMPIRVILRSKIPDEYSYLKSEREIEIYEDCLPPEEFSKIFLESDVFLFPCYQSPGLAFLDAMNFFLPIVTTNVFSNSEMVVDGYNGFLVDLPKTSGVNFLEIEYGIKGVQTGKKIRDDDIPKDMIEKFCKKIETLRDSDALRREMGRNSKRLLRNHFTLEVRNRNLMSIFNKILSRQ